MNYHLLYNLLLLGYALPIISGAFRFKALDTGLRVFWLLSCATFLVETAAYFAAVRYRHNLSVYSLSSIVGVFITCLYFNYSIPSFRKRHWGYIIGAVSVAVGITCNFIVQSSREFPSYFLHYQALVIIAMSLYALVKMLQVHGYFNIWQAPHFWASTILIFFWSATYFNWSLMEYYTHQLQQQNATIILCSYLVNLIANLSISLLFFVTPKMQHHVG